MARYGGRVSPRRWGAVYLQRCALYSGGTDGLEGFGGRVGRLVQRQGEGRRSRRRRPMGGGVAAAVWLFGLVGFSPLLWPVAPVMAATFTVTSTADNLTNGDGFCTLREAISAANNAATNDCGSASAGNDTIVLQSGATYTLNLDGTAGDEDANAEDDLDIAGVSAAGTLTIQGNGATIQRSTAVLCDPNGSVVAGEFRIFEVLSGFGGGGNLTLQDVTVKEGCAEQGSGGGISVSFGAAVTVASSTISNNSAAGFGGGIDNFGTVTLTNSAVSSNSAVFTGGGMRNTSGSTATVTNSTISGNSAGFDGGAIENSGTVTITGSTISNNSSGDDGGGIWNDGEVNASFITIANNTGSSSGAGGIFNDSGGTLNMKNSIVGDNTAGGSSNCQNLGTINATGINLATDSSCGAGFTSVSSSALNLGPLANNGGPTQTHALQSGSAAIDAVTDCTDLGSASVTADQRGISRPQGPRCDVGAYEVLRAGAAPLPAVAPLGRLVLLTLLVLTGIGALWRRSRELGAARD